MIKNANLNFMLVTLFLVALVTPICANAELFMSVSGKVIAEDNGAPLSGVKILLTSQLYPEKGIISETKSNAQGVFVLRNVPRGIQNIAAFSESPFIQSSKTNVPVTVPDGKNVVGVAIKLQLGNLWGQTYTIDNSLILRVMSNV